MSACVCVCVCVHVCVCVCVCVCACVFEGGKEDFGFLGGGVGVYSRLEGFHYSTLKIRERFCMSAITYNTNSWSR